MISKTSFLLVTFLVIMVIAVNTESPKEENDGCYYCGDELTCTDRDNRKVQHELCHNGLEFGPECHNATYIQITDELRDLFLNGQNEKKNLIALGKLGGVFIGKLVARMPTLIWDDELEMISLGNVLQCIAKRVSLCTKTKRYPNTGQLTFTTEDDQSIERKVNEAIEAWFEHYTSIDDTELIKPINSRSENLLSSELSIEKSSAVGCAAIKYQENSTNILGFTCTYNLQPLGDLPVYGNVQVGSKCQTGKNSKFPGLCSETEFKTNISEALPVTEWIKNGKKIGINI